MTCTASASFSTPERTAPRQSTPNLTSLAAKSLADPPPIQGYARACNRQTDVRLAKSSVQRHGSQPRPLDRIARVPKARTFLSRILVVTLSDRIVLLPLRRRQAVARNIVPALSRGVYPYSRLGSLGFPILPQPSHLESPFYPSVSKGRIGSGTIGKGNPFRIDRCERHPSPLFSSRLMGRNISRETVDGASSRRFRSKPGTFPFEPQLFPSGNRCFIEWDREERISRITSKERNATSRNRSVSSRFRTDRTRRFSRPPDDLQGEERGSKT